MRTSEFSLSNNTSSNVIEGGSAKPMFIQPKLTIGSANDHFEQEADRTADQVMRMPMTNSVSVGGNENGIQRKCAACEHEEEHIQKKSLEITPIIHRSSADGGGVASDSISNQIESSRGGGQAMSDNTRGFMESRFGNDFSGVRIHTDSNAIQLSNNLNAQAFTVGNDIFFNQGKYQPESDSGKHLLAHELTHTIQQGGGIRRKIQINDPSAITDGATTKTNLEEARDQFGALNPSFTINSVGELQSNGSSTCTSPSEVRDRCLCEMVAAPDIWTIKINNNEWPHTNHASNSISIQNSFSNISFGAWGGNSQTNTRISQSLARVLGHELCGHAHLMQTGSHPTFDPRTGFQFGRPHHTPTIRIENQIADEIEGQNAPDRGEFTDPHQGESFGSITISNYSSNSSDFSTSPDAGKIAVAANFLNNDRNLKADIIGHSDQIGNANRISKNRARKIRSELVRLGVHRRQIKKSIGMGSTECSLTGDQPTCRKTEIFMYLFSASGIR